MLRSLTAGCSPSAPLCWENHFKCYSRSRTMGSCSSERCALRTALSSKAPGAADTLILRAAVQDATAAERRVTTQHITRVGRTPFKPPRLHFNINIGHIENIPTNAWLKIERLHREVKGLPWARTRSVFHRDLAKMVARLAKPS